MTLRVVRNLGSGKTHVMEVHRQETMQVLGAKYQQPYPALSVCGVKINDGVIMQPGTKVGCGPCKHVSGIAEEPQPHEHAYGPVVRAGERPITASEIGGGLGASGDDVVGSRGLLGRVCVCGEVYLLSEEEVVEFKEYQRLAVFANNEMMRDIGVLKTLQERTVRRLKKVGEVTQFMAPESCPWCGGTGLSFNGCSDPDCCPPSEALCLRCQPEARYV